MPTALRSLLRRALSRTPVWRTPHQWADAGGLYATSDQAWLYQELPQTALRPSPSGTTPLDDLLERLGQAAPGREVHLLMHAWEERCSTPASGHPGLDDYLSEASNFFVPTRKLVIGLRLQPGPSSEPPRGITSVVDTVLGEAVPDLTVWDQDRETLTGLLSTFGATALDTSASEHLEAWFSLGVGTDLEAVERDDVVFVDETNVIELVAAAGIRPVGAAAALVAAGRRGATVASVRGQVRGPGSGMSAGHSGLRQSPTGSLQRVSVVLGRRAESPAAPWAVDLRRLGGLVVRPLPLRQLEALEETLPCGSARVSPTLGRIRSQELSRVGFAETSSAGDDRGLLLGLSCPDYSYPCWLDLDADAAPVTVVTGSAGSGKTFLGEAVALQAIAAGRAVVYLSSSAAAGSGLRSAADAVRRPLDVPGALNPYAFLSPAAGSRLTQQALTALLPGLEPGDHRALASGFRRAAAVGARGLDQVLQFADGADTVARVRAALAAHPQLATVFGGDLTPPEDSPVVLGILPGTATTTDRSLSDLAVALYLHRAAETGTPTLVVVDGCDAVLDGTATAAALTVGGPAHLLVLTRATGRVAGSTLASAVGRVVTLAEDSDEEADAAAGLVGLKPSAARRAWYREAAPRVRDGHVHRPALGVHVDRRGRRESVLIGPVAASALPALTRRRGAQYVTAG